MNESDYDGPEGVAIVCRSFDRWADEDLAGTLEYFDEDCEIRPILVLIEGGLYRGHEGVRRWFSDVFSDWTEFCPEIHGSCELEDSLLTTGRIRARGRTSGVELDTRMWWRHTFRDGRILRMEAFREPTADHRAAGLADQPGLRPQA